MRDISTLFLHAIVTIVRLAQPGGLRAVVAESVLMRHQVLILNRGRKRAPNLRPLESDHRWIVHFTNPSRTCFSVGYRLKDLDPTAFSQSAGPAKIPAAVLSQTSRSA